LFLQRIAEVQDVYIHDQPASAAAWQRLLERARRGQVNEEATAKARARIGLARELDAMFETDRAIDQLRIVAAANPASPYGDGAPSDAEPLLARALALAPADSVARYRYAHALDVLGQRDRAREELERVLATPAVPPFVLASAYVDYAASLERAGDRDRALALY